MPSLSPWAWLVLIVAAWRPGAQSNPSLKPGLHPGLTAPAGGEDGIDDKKSAESRAESVPAGGCDPAYSRHAKTLTLARLAYPSADASNRRGLLGVERALPKRLGRELRSGGILAGFHELDQELVQGQDAPERVRWAARRKETQLVLTGELISTAGPDRNRGFLTASRDALIAGLKLNPDWDSRQRQFVLALRLHQGVTGDLFWQRTYATQGAWRPGQASNSSRFQSPAFRDSDYGAQVERLLEKIVADLTQVIQCRPLVGWLEDRGPGTQPLLALGSRHGLQVGEKLRVFRLQRQPLGNGYQ